MAQFFRHYLNDLRFRPFLIELPNLGEIDDPETPAESPRQISGKTLDQVGAAIRAWTTLQAILVFRAPTGQKWWTSLTTPQRVG
jgi:hypothetical protein